MVVMLTVILVLVFLSVFVVIVMLFDVVIRFYFHTDVDDCFNNECKNSATCIDGVDSYTCKCAPGFVGKHCETS